MSETAHDPHQRPLIAVATRSRKAVNQDAAAVACHPDLPLAGVVVADGLGSHFGADEAARIAVTTVTESIESAHDTTSQWLLSAFAAARLEIERLVCDRSETLPAELNLAEAFGTTLLCGMDMPDRLMVGYVGNGAIIHLRGDFLAFPPTQLLPWNAVNYLNPHSRMVRGTNVLYKWLGPQTTAAQSSPTVLEIAKDDSFVGDLLLVCSDGISSLDQTPIGLDADKRMWIRADRSVAMLYAHLKEFIAHEALTSDALHVCLEHYLLDLDAAHLVGDDCTIGVVVTAAAVKGFESRRSAAEALANEDHPRFEIVHHRPRSRVCQCADDRDRR
jgi:serine/threonine protein phosphatase PrpC